MPHAPEPRRRYRSDARPKRDELEAYRRKRRFGRTPEPEDDVGATRSGHLYVVQKHAARRLHYDLRLELDGVLKSWAVPKGPSLNPAEKRLAVHVEDHPVTYGSFEGIIPQGEYGGGTVMLWDRGEWEPLGDAQAGYRQGKLRFRLLGEKLRGAWMLVRIHGDEEDPAQDAWLLRKEQDEYAQPGVDVSVIEAEPLSVLTGRTMEEIAKARDKEWSSREAGAKTSAPEHVPASVDPATLSQARKGPQPTKPRPQLATLVEWAPDGHEWLHEVKYDGYRLLCVLKDGEARLLTRNGHDWTAHFPGLAQATSRLGVRNAVIDGEVVALDKTGKPDFQALQNALKQKRKPKLAYYLFDLPYCDGYDLTRTPLVERKDLLRALLLRANGGGDPLRYSDHLRGHGPVVLQQACRLDLEGVISKQADSPYEGRRSRHWLKAKCGKRQEFVVGGYTEPTGSREAFGALLLGYYTAEGRLRYCGRAGTGFTDRSLKEVHAELTARRRERPSFENPPSPRNEKGLHWVEPELVAEVQFLGWTEEGLLRHPSFKGLRLDRSAKEVRREEPASAPSPAPRPRRPGEEKPVAGVRLTNPDKVLYPEQGLTKQNVAAYYEKVAEWMLPHVTGRPLTLVRCPEGYDKPCFHQKHLRDAWPEAVGGVTVKEGGEEARYVVVEDLAGLIALVQLGVLEIHPWGSRADRLDRPDRLIFDLDPGPNVSWAAVVEAAWHVRLRLANLGLESFVKTTGGKGLHVVVPLLRRATWDDVKAFARGFSENFARNAPDRFTASQSKARREGRIYLDYLRNARGATAVAPYSTRARSGAPVAAPLDWDELDAALDPAAFNVATVPARLAKLSRDPWRDLNDIRQALTKTMLEAVTPKTRRSRS